MTKLYARVPTVTGWREVTHVRTPDNGGWQPITDFTAIWTSRVVAPTTLSVTSTGSGQVVLSWTAVVGTPTAYTVRTYNRSTGALVSTTAFGNVLTGTITGLTNGTAYNFTVTATVGGVETAVSNTVTATPASAATVPTPGTLSKGAVTATTVALSWTAPVAPTSAPVTAQTVYVRTSTGTLVRTLNPAATDTSIVVGATTPLTTGTAYTFTVTATNSVGESAVSNAVTATPAASTVKPYLLGLYPGVVSNNPTSVSTALGGTTANPVRPDVVSMYVQTAQAGNLAAFIDNWASVGVFTHVAVTTVDKYTTNATTGVRTRTESNAQTYMVGLINGTTTAVNFWKGILATVEAKSVLYPDCPPVVFPACEPDVHWENGQGSPQDGNFGSIWDGMSPTAFPTDTDKNNEGMRILGAFHKAFFDLARSVNPATGQRNYPHVQTGMWLAGFQATQTSTQPEMGIWFTAMANAVFDFLGTDPYANGTVATGATPSGIWTPRVNMWRTGGHWNSIYLGWGSPPLILTETGISHQVKNGAAVNSPTDIATWLGGMREDQRTLDIKRVVYFNANGGSNGDQSITDQGTTVVTAFRNELAETP